MKRNIFGLNLTSLLRMTVLGLFSLSSVTSFGQCNAVNPLEVPAELMNAGYEGSGNFNAIVFGNYNTGDGGKAAGRLLVGGNFTLNSVGGGYQVGVADGSAVDKDNLVIEGSLSNSSGGQIKVRGNAKYGSLSGGSAVPVHDAGQGANSIATGLFDYTDLKTYYQNLSIIKSTLSQVGSVNVTNGVVTLTGNGTVANYVFNVTLIGGEITDVKYVNIPVGSEILMNVSNTIVTIAPTTGSTPMETTFRDKTLFNFPNAESILLSSFVLEGGLLAPNANLSASSAQVKGAAVVGGNILLATDFSFETGCFVNPLPVTLSSFSARREGYTSNLAWSTTSESNARKFVIERSATAQLWESIGEINAIGESAKLKNYYFADHSPLAGDNFYRLKMVDMDASFAYSRILTLDFAEKPSVTIYPNPVTTGLSIQSTSTSEITNVEIVDQTGKTMLNESYIGKDIDVKNWSSGLYLIKLRTAKGHTSTHKILKN